MITIRPFEPRDYEAVNAIRNSIQPEPTTVAELQASDQRLREGPANNLIRLVAEDLSGNVLGYVNAGYYYWSPPQRFSHFVAVAKEHRGRGIGSLLLEAAHTWALEQGARGEFSAFMRGDDEESFAWAQRRGYYLDLQRTEAVLDLQRWDPTRLRGHLARVQSSGLTFMTVQGRVPDALFDGMYAVESATAPDVPDYEGHMPTREEWAHFYQESFDRLVTAIGLDGEQVVAFSTLVIPRSKGKSASIEYTGVLREYRGRGLALALKLLQTSAALEYGVASIRTNNDLDNPAMLAVNAKLGYVLVPGPAGSSGRLTRWTASAGKVVDPNPRVVMSSVGTR